MQGKSSRDAESTKLPIMSHFYLLKPPPPYLPLFFVYLFWFHYYANEVVYGSPYFLSLSVCYIRTNFRFCFQPLFSPSWARVHWRICIHSKSRCRFFLKPTQLNFKFVLCSNQLNSNPTQPNTILSCYYSFTQMNQIHPGLLNPTQPDTIQFNLISYSFSAKSDQ